MIDAHRPPPPLDVEGQKVTVFGMARSGVAAAGLLVRHGAAVTVVDQKTASQLQTRIDELARIAVHVAPGITQYRELADPDIIVVSPGVPTTHPLLEEARANGAMVIGEIELAYRFSTCPLIAVTGTNGKGTVVKLIGGMLAEAGLDAPVVGNIGIPLISAVENAHDVLVTEVSSFQLETIDCFSPWIAAILNITSDHRDRHPTTADYIAAKSRILRNQSPQDYAILNTDDPNVAGLIGSARACTLTVSLADPDATAHIDGDALLIRTADGRPQPICSVDDIPLGGPHNISNALTAALAASLCGVAPEAMARAIAAQEPAKHLLQDAGAVGGVRFINDSKATNPAAAIADLSAVDGPVVLIAGGDPKGLDLTEFAEVAAKRAEHIIVIGQSGPDIVSTIGDRAPVSSASTLQEAVRMAYELSRPGWTVLLAPACASFDMFENMSQRGEVFCDAVSELADGTAHQQR